MRLTPEEVRRLAALARLEVSEAEAEGLAVELAEILGRIDALPAGGAETQGGGEVEGVNRLEGAGFSTDGLVREGGPRADVPGTDPLDRPPSEWAVEWREGFFVVPRIGWHDGGEGA